MAVPLILGGLGALGGLFSSGPKRQTTNQSFNNQSTQTPIIGPELQAIINEGLKRTIERQPVDLTGGFQSQGVSNINRAAELAQMAIGNRAAQLGQLRSPGALAALASNEIGRVGSAVNFQNQLPLLQREQERLDFAQLLGLGSIIPVGQQTNSSGTSTGTSVQSGNRLGGLFGGAGGMLGLLAGLGQLNLFGGGKGGFDFSTIHRDIP